MYISEISFSRTIRIGDSFLVAEILFSTLYYSLLMNYPLKKTTFVR